MIDELLGPAGLKVVLDFCELDIAENTDKLSDLSATVHVKKKKKTYALELLPKYVMFSVLLDFSKHGTMVSTACPPVLVGAGCGRHCNL